MGPQINAEEELIFFNETHELSRTIFLSQKARGEKPPPVFLLPKRHGSENALAFTKSFPYSKSLKGSYRTDIVAKGLVVGVLPATGEILVPRATTIELRLRRRPKSV